MATSVTQPKVYLDNCCFNRPYDRQDHLRIKLETEAKLHIQDLIREGALLLVWSFMLTYENSRNPFEIRREQIQQWRDLASAEVSSDADILDKIHTLRDRYQIDGADAVHLAAAVSASCDYFFTTDDGILRKTACMESPAVLNPLDFIRKEGM